MAQGHKTGGRQKGSQNKTTLAREAAEQAAVAEAIVLLPPELIDALQTPADFLDAAWRALARAGSIPQAIAVAEKAAPYFNARRIAKPERGEEDEVAALGGYVVIPEQSESVEAWTAQARQELQGDEKSGDPNEVPKASS